MAEINWTAEAEQWLQDIYDYIAQDKPDAAANVIAGLYAKVQILRDFPEMGYSYSKECEGEVRILLYGHYRIAYLIKSADCIDILGIFHGSLDIGRFLLFK
ncbi:type II toxin-antitoxin system RelE/ParE family toxin [Methylovulum psychrotolerans]|uniref:type II toxin-antitoxin system RelE/ParE family toxin n=1 Tax=Methylovulum psychrotolerans TaxID=1704499 RepID=UPI001BFF9BCB|nr:type II toxin-antitoxin system RelE/ParE family toxin [Methylovulum psychrotolerans]MBT9099410.1 type II toxin-antitoxin system RelE/ParE family toxin [Methylovulum psychrotolerans]